MKATVSVAAPRVAAWLGYGGLLPFVGLALLAWVDPGRAGLWAGNLRAYGAVILSFVGALHWAFAMTMGELTKPQRDATLAWSVVPPLIAFAALAAHSVLGDLLLLSGFLLHYLQDLRLAARVALPAWYLPLRLRLSAVAMLCVALGAFATVR